MSNQRVLVTGGASGIGRHIAEKFLENGASVFVADCDERAIDKLLNDLPGVTAGMCDVSRCADVAKMVDSCASRLGGLDVLVNNAGIGGPTAPVDQVEPDDWDTVIGVDLNGTFYVTRSAIPHLKDSKAGVIINMSSAAGRFGYANRSPYCAAKWGLVGFTKTLAIELGQFGIRANAILPGAVDGPRARRVYEGRAELSGRSMEEVMTEAMSIQSLKQLVDPANVAALTVFLASDSARSISGQMIPIDNDMQQAS